MRSILIGVLVMSTGGVFGIAATAQPEPSTPTVRNGTALHTLLVSGTGKALTADNATRQDAEELAKDLGLDKTTALQRASAQHQWDELIARLSSNEKTFASAGRDWSADIPAWISLTSSPSDEVMALINELPFDVRLTTNAAANESEAVLASETAFMAVANTSGVEAARSSLDPETNAITIEYRLTKGTSIDPRELQSRALRVSAAAFGDDELPVPIRLVNNPGLASEAAYWGGAPMWLASNSAFECTSAFGVSRSGVNGTTTAQHCQNGLLWGEAKQSGVISYVGAASGTTGGAIDLQFHKSLPGFSADSTFQATGTAASQRRRVTSAANAVAGDAVCKFGWGEVYNGNQNGYSCTQVGSLNQCVTYNNTTPATWCGMAVTTSDIVFPGDSGGPFFLGNQAVGSTSGHGNSHTYLVPQTRWASNLSATILKG